MISSTKDLRKKILHPRNRVFLGEKYAHTRSMEVEGTN